jgi:hypothetical protein
MPFHSTEPYTQRFGDDARNHRTALSGEMHLTDTTSISTTISPDKGQALVKLGSCQVYGNLPELEVASAAFKFAVDALSNGEDTKDPEEQEQPSLCKSCLVTHSRREPCSSVGTDKLRKAAYARMAKTHMITPQAAGLFVDAAAMFVERGDLVAARMLLHQFVMDDVAAQVVGILVSIQQASDPRWSPPPTQWPYPPGHPSRDGARQMLPSPADQS